MVRFAKEWDEALDDETVVLAVDGFIAYPFVRDSVDDTFVFLLLVDFDEVLTHILGEAFQLDNRVVESLINGNDQNLVPFRDFSFPALRDVACHDNVFVIDLSFGHYLLLLQLL
jgi:hypothetical protein